MDSWESSHRRLSVNKKDSYNQGVFVLVRSYNHRGVINVYKSKGT